MVKVYRIIVADSKISCKRKKGKRSLLGDKRENRIM
jgi:hypothetical protein